MAAAKKRDKEDGPRLTAEQKAELTLLHYKDWSHQRLADHYGVSPATINRAIKESRSNNWVTIVVTNNLELPPAERDDHLARKVIAKFDSIRTLFVLKSDPPPAKSGGQAYAVWSDRVHRCVGNYLGSHHVRHAIMDSDSIGVSSGRGVFHAIEGLVQDTLPLQVQNVSLLSLTGSFEMRGQSASNSIVMDGDTNTAYFVRAFGRMIRLQTTGRGIVTEHEDADRPPWFRTPPNKALIGLGIFEGTNRMLSGALSLAPLKEELSALERLVQQVTRGDYVPCADTCNFLFWVEPPKGVTVSASSEREIKRLIDVINERLCCWPFH